MLYLKFFQAFPAVFSEKQNIEHPEVMKIMNCLKLFQQFSSWKLYY